MERAGRGEGTQSILSVLFGGMDSDVLLLWMKERAGAPVQAAAGAAKREALRGAD
jgi:hypothetical protein